MSTRYGPVAQAFHWLTALLVLAAFIMGPGGSEERVYSAARDFDRQWHEVLGLCVLSLTVLRLLWRMFHRAPEIPTIAWMRHAGKVAHYVLYALLIATPLTAIAGAWLEGHPLTLGVLGSIPPLIPKSHALGSRIAELHTWLGDAVIWLAGAHAAAALLHHFVLRDGVLRSMLPWAGRNCLD